MKEKVIEYVKLVRLPGWGAYCIPAVFGALTTNDADIWRIVVLFIIGMFATIFGFVLNDYADVSTDRLSPDLAARPLVKGSIPVQNALYISVIAAVLHYLIVFIAMAMNFFIPSYLAILVLTIAAFFTVIYNLFGKKIIGSDFFVASATALYCLFGALVVSTTIGGLTWVVVIVTFIQVLYLNAVIGGLKDADHDFMLGGKNIALRLGVKADKDLFIPFPFKAFALVLRSLSAMFMFIPLVFFADFDYYLWQPVLMVFMFLGVFISTVKMLNLKIFDRSELRKLISIQAFLRYSVVPVMLLREIGYPIGLFLIIFPFTWFAVFNRILYGKTVQPDTL